MTRRFDNDVLEQAIAWHLRLADGDADIWDHFTEWLEADPRNNDAYEYVADRDESLKPVLAATEFPEDPGVDHLSGAPIVDDRQDGPQVQSEAPPPQARRWAWAAIAASLALALLFSMQFLPRPTSYTIATSPGQTQTVKLADGSEIILNGGTKVVLDRNDTRNAELVAGEAQFSVEHDDANPFVVRVGERRLVDIGTVFVVTRTQDLLELEVAEGAVRFEGPARNLELQAGERLTVDAANNVAVVKKSVDTMGSWTQGMLVYDDATIAEIGSDLSRAVGISIEFSPALQERRFSGVIQTQGSRSEVRARLEQLLDLAIRPDGDRWVVEP